MKLVNARCLAYRVAGKTAVVLFAWPFYAIDLFAEKLAAAVTILCALGAAPTIIFYDWCVKRHNTLRRLALDQDRQDGRGR